MTKVINQEDIDLIVKSLNDGQVVAFPTETIYGIGVKYGNKDTLDKLFKVKNRSKEKAITVMLSHREDISKFAYVNEKIEKVANHFMPGKITLVLKRREEIDKKMTNGLDTIGIRIPDSKFVLDLIDKVGPLLVTSANISGGINTTNEKEVLKQLDGKIDLVVKGQTKSSEASTVVLLDEDVKLLRKGQISEEEIKGVFNS